MLLGFRIRISSAMQITLTARGGQPPCLSKVIVFSFMNYSEKVLDHFHHPRHAGEIAHADAVVEAVNPVCGDVLKLWGVLRDGVLTEVKFKAAGCVPAIACGSWLAEWTQGKPLEALKELPPGNIENALGGLPPASKHASVLAADALKLLVGKLASSK